MVFRYINNTYKRYLNYSKANSLSKKIDPEIKRIFDKLECFVLITDCELESPGPLIVFMNKFMSEFTGFSNRLIGETPRKLQSKNTSRNVLDRLKNSLISKIPFFDITYQKCNDGSEYLVGWIIEKCIFNGTEFFISFQIPIEHTIHGISTPDGTLDFYSLIEELQNDTKKMTENFIINDFFKVRIKIITINLIETQIKLFFKSNDPIVLFIEKIKQTHIDLINNISQNIFDTYDDTYKDFINNELSKVLIKTNYKFKEI